MSNPSVPILCKHVDPASCELEGPYECPRCSGHVMLDATFLDQVSLEVVCPYCECSIVVPEESI
jgi:DNA-directed RNA polymerase subunit RPC12/RpoP